MNTPGPGGKDSKDGTWVHEQERLTPPQENNNHNLLQNRTNSSRREPPFRRSYAKVGWYIATICAIAIIVFLVVKLINNSNNQGSKSSGRRFEPERITSFYKPNATSTTDNPKKGVLHAILSQVEGGLCNTEDCQNTLREMRMSLNTSVDPCDNFYEFACQGWEKQNPRPNYISRWNVFQKQKQRTNTEVIDILAEPVRYFGDILDPADPQALRQAKGFFKKCQDTERNTDLGHMWEILEEYGGWPLLYPEGTWNSSQFNWMKTVADLKRRFDRIIILDVVSYQHPVGKIDNNRIVLQPASSTRSGSEGIAPEEQIKPADNPVAKIMIIKDFIVNVSRELLLVKGETYINETYLEEKAFQIILVQAELFDVAQKNVSRLFKLLHGFSDTRVDTTLDKLQNLIDTYLIFYQMDLREFLSIVYYGANVYIAEDESVFVTDLDYLLEVSNFVTSLKTEALANFLHFQMVIELASLTNGKMQEYVQTLKAMLYGTTEEKPRSTYCSEIAQAKFYHALGHAYVTRKHPDWMHALVVVDKAGNVFRRVKEQLKKLVTFSNVRHQNRTLLQTKISISGICMGFPSWIYNAQKMQLEYVGLHLYQETYLEQYLAVNAWSIDKQLKILRQKRDITTKYCDWSRFVGTVGAYNDVKYYTVYAPLGILQAPYFNIDFPSALNYGKLGTILGHELTHGLGSVGWTTFQNGSLNPNAQCFARQYDNYTTAELYAQNITLDGILTLGENIPDNAGLLQAYKAFKSTTPRSWPEKTLPEMGSYTNDQLFFISFAQNWCESNTYENIRRALQKDKHSPGMFRVLGTLRNSKEFARSWNCPAGSKMNPHSSIWDKCSMF